MTRLASRFGAANSIRRDRPLTIEELFRTVLSVFSDKKDDLWTVYQRLQENLIKGGLSGRNAKGKRARTRSVNGIDGDIKLNKALWVMTEKMYEHFSCS